ncbi:TetR/AcrR family transcriptional regulator [Nocardia speluncae]|uniref:TetR/AcrR family transcriptional regulator n=1 Tax=Nocardia speluncae TaxID=419477 RepID=A0A846XF74_9NOCA|nr:TetR/AcrR family transcriptional regulator [Nocardia speluncae]NKY33380.1 TetR/AcrR family transcriptional regulator [Nocardia speluncae]
MSSAVDSRQALLEAAEQLYAARGLEGVSMRDIAAAAGHRNNSAVQYHFGSREGLLRAIFRFRMRTINEVRRAYLDNVVGAGREGDVRALVEAEIRPLTEFLAETPDGSYYARFLARVSPSVDFTLPELSEVQGAGREIVQRLIGALGHLPRRVALTRIDLMFNMIISALALVEQRRAEGRPQLSSLDDTVDHLIDMAVGALLADRTGAS